MTAPSLSHTCAASSLRVVVGFALGSALGACASSGDEPPVSTVDAGSNMPGMDAGMARECAIYDEGTTRACSCGASTGTQACLGGKYQACKCAVVPVDAGGVTGNLCKAGFYSGQFTGKYKPGAFGFGLFESPLEVDIMGAGANGYPALSFTLEADQQGSGEFQTYTVKNGCMIGNANAYGTNNPFVGRISGELNCRTGIFDGTIVGRYDLLGLNLKFDFAGTANQGQFELPQARIKDGVWNVKEPAALLSDSQGGGGGTWSATWESDNPPAGEDPCASADLPDAGPVVSDAGTAPRDAGTPPSDAGN